jgi:diguanylate cyclase (GGDEF)-like protein
MELWLKARFYDLKVFSSSYIISENLQQILDNTENQVEKAVATSRIKAYLASVREKFTDYQELMLASMIADPLVSTSDEALMLNLPDQWFGQLKSGRPVIGPDYWDPSLDRRVITLAEVIKSSDNRPLGILAVKIDLASIHEILKQKTVGSVDEIYITDSRGRLIVSSRVNLEASPAPRVAADLPAAADRPAAPDEYVNFRKHPVVGIAARIPATELTAVAEMDKAGAYADIMRLRTITVVLVFILLLTMGALAYVLGQTIAGPLNQLSSEAGRVAAGDLNVDIPVRGTSEISYLTQVFNHMVSSLQRGRKEIAQAHEALMEKNRQLHELSITDGLTGLFNRKHLMDLFDMERTRNIRYHVPFSVLIADIDHFKRINDTYGHLAGDAVLRRIADTLNHVVRECDHVGRYGGEEFLIILPNSDAAGAMEVAQRVRQQVSQVRFYNDGKEISLTISVGVAQCTEADDSAEAVLGRADDALYRAKANGRNQVIGP